MDILNAGITFLFLALIISNIIYSHLKAVLTKINILKKVKWTVSHNITRFGCLIIPPSTGIPFRLPYISQYLLTYLY